MQTIRDTEQLAEATEQLVALEPRFSIVVRTHGVPPLRRAPESLPTLLRIVTDQLISLSAAAAIWKRLESELWPLTADTIIDAGEARLRQLGLSGAKARAFLAVSHAFLEGHFHPSVFEALDDSAARRHITAVKGLGPWSADIYLLSAMGRADAWPSNDVALQISAQNLFSFPRRPDAAELDGLAEGWRPLRSVAARLLWSHYRGIRGVGQDI